MRDFNHKIAQIQPSASLVIMDKARTMQSEGAEIISLAGGEPDFVTPQRICSAAKASMDDGNTHYVAGKGILPLREAVCHKLQTENGIACTPENILITPGGKFGIYLALTALLNPGDEALIMDPSWVSYAPIVQASGAVPVGIGLSFADDYQITREKLETACTERTKVLIVNSPNNPTGRMLNEKEVAVIAAFAKEKDLFIVADEIYEKIRYDNRAHFSLGAIPSIAEQVITVNGFSKCVAMTGWRLGYVVACQTIMKNMYRLYQHTATCVSGFAQTGALQAFQCDQEIEEMRLQYARRRDFFVDGLNEIPGITCRKPEGAFYAWAKIEKDHMDSRELAEFILDKAGVACVPGPAYGKGCEGFVRFSFANTDEDLHEALRRMKLAFSTGGETPCMRHNCPARLSHKRRGTKMMTCPFCLTGGETST